jgi:DNA primase
VALLGAGTSDSQMDVLNSTPIRTYILLYDNDKAGRHGAERFKKLVRKDVFVVDILLPEGRDVNDLNQQEFYALLDSYGLKYIDII